MQYAAFFSNPFNSPWEPKRSGEKVVRVKKFQPNTEKYLNQGKFRLKILDNHLITPFLAEVGFFDHGHLCKEQANERTTYV